MPVRLLTPAEALQEALTLLDAAIANATKPAVRAYARQGAASRSSGTAAHPTARCGCSQKTNPTRRPRSSW